MRDIARPPEGGGPPRVKPPPGCPGEGWGLRQGFLLTLGLPFTPPAPGCLREASGDQAAEAERPQGLSPTWHVDLGGERTGAQLLTGQLPVPGPHRPASAAPLAPWSDTKPRACVVLSCKGHIWGQASQVHDHFCFAFLSAASCLQRPESSWPNQIVLSGRSPVLPAQRTVWARTGSRALTCALCPVPCT